MKKIQIERPVIEWEYRALFGKTKVVWMLAPVEWTVKDPKTQKGVGRKLDRRQEQK